MKENMEREAEVDMLTLVKFTRPFLQLTIRHTEIGFVCMYMCLKE